MSGTSSYYLIAPAERTNLIPNPSFEQDKSSNPWGWTIAATSNLTFVFWTPTVVAQRFGYTSLRLGYTENVAGTVALTSGTINVDSAGTYTASCYVRGWTAGAIEVVLSVGGINAGTFENVGTTLWQRLSVSAGVPAGTTWVRIMVRRAGGSVGSAAIYLDGVQLEQGGLTTYLDGDQDDCVWLGQPHRSASYRPATTRAGGTMYPLAGLRAYPTDHAGVGMAPVTNLAIDRSDYDGAMYQRSRSPERAITITASIVGTSLADLHAARRALIDAVKPNATPNPQPLWLMYTGAGKELVVPVHYAGGLDVTDMDTVADTAALQFVAYDPIWQEVGHQGTQLNGWTALGTVQGVVWRDPLGRWGTLPGAGGTPFGTSPIIYHVNADRTGTLVVCGAFDRVENGTVNRIAMLASGTWQRLAGTNGSIGLPSGTPYAMAWNGNRTHLFVGGRIGSIASGAGTSLAMWRGSASGTVGTWVRIPGLGTAAATGGSAIVYDIEPYTNGTLLITGDFWCTSLFGTSQGAAWLRTDYVPENSLVPTTDPVAGLGGTRILHQAYRLGPHAFFVAGSFTAPGGTAGGTHVASLSFADGTPAWGTYRWQPGTTLGGGIVTRSGEVYVTVAANAAGSRGHFRVRRGGATRLAGQSWGSVAHMPPIPWGRPIAETRQGRIVMLVGTLPALGNYQSRWPEGDVLHEALLIAEYAGGGWIPDLIAKRGDGTMIPHGITEGADGTIYVWGHLWFAGWAPRHQIVVNDASHDAYPIIMWENGRITAIVNRTTGDGIYGDLATARDERAYIDTRPDRARVWSEVQGDLTSLLLPTSRLAGFRLAPGTNYLQIHATNTMYIWWTPRYWSFDG